MSWFTMASRRLWQAYREGLEMNCPMRRVDGYLACARDSLNEAARDSKPAAKVAKRVMH